MTTNDPTWDSEFYDSEQYDPDNMPHCGKCGGVLLIEAHSMRHEKSLFCYPIPQEFLEAFEDGE